MSIPYEQLSTNLEARIDNILNMDWLQAQQTPSLFTFGSSSPGQNISITQIPNLPNLPNTQVPVQPVPIIFGSTNQLKESNPPKFSMAVVVLCILIGILIVLVGFIVYNLITQKEPSDEEPGDEESSNEKKSKNLK